MLPLGFDSLDQRLLLAESNLPNFAKSGTKEPRRSIMIVLIETTLTMDIDVHPRSATNTNRK